MSRDSDTLACTVQVLVIVSTVFTIVAGIAAVPMKDVGDFFLA